MDVNDPGRLGSIETQLMANVLDYGVQFLDPIPAEHKTRLAQELVRDMRSAQNGAAFDQAAVERLTGDWFNRGRIYEIMPEDALVPTEDLNRSADQLFLDHVPSKMAEKAIADLRSVAVARLAESPYAPNGEDAVCSLFWMWFIWGRSYQKGNPPDESPLPN